MIPRRAVLSGFFGLPTTEVVYPEQGVMTVTGRNGRGKSARYLEAPAWAGWGETLRGTPPGKDCIVEFETDRLLIRRSSKRSPRLVWNYVGEKPMEFETSTKAEAALERELGSFYSWARSSIFSSVDAALFSAAGDADRKRLLEKLIGADIFDDAMAIAKEAIDKVSASANTLREEESNLASRILETRNAIAEMAEVTASAPPPGEDLLSLQAKQRELSIEHRQKYAEFSRAATSVSLLQGKLQQLEQSAAYVLDGRCRTCGQVVHPDVLHAHSEEVDRLKAEVDEAKRLSDAVRKQAHSQVHALELEIAGLQDKMQEVLKYNPAAAERISFLKSRGRDLIKQHAGIQRNRTLLDDQLAVLRHTQGVLGIKGVRSALLATALERLQDLANTYLAWLSSKATIELRAQTETLKGTVQEKIVIMIHGMGGGYGYKALSGGERCRINLVLLMALASLSRTRGTLVFDEAFDAMDDEGLEQALKLVLQLSENRPIVVISHNKELIGPLTKAGSLIVV